MFAMLLTFWKKDFLCFIGLYWCWCSSCVLIPLLFILSGLILYDRFVPQDEGFWTLSLNSTCVPSELERLRLRSLSWVLITLCWTDTQKDIVTPWPTVWAKTLFRHVLNGNNFQETMKGIICTKTNISNIIMNNNTQNNFSTKQPLMVLFGVFTVLGFTSYYFFSALKQRSSKIFLWLKSVR